MRKEFLCQKHVLVSVSRGTTLYNIVYVIISDTSIELLNSLEAAFSLRTSVIMYGSSSGKYRGQTRVFYFFFFIWCVFGIATGRTYVSLSTFALTVADCAAEKSILILSYTASALKRLYSTSFFGGFIGILRCRGV